MATPERLAVWLGDGRVGDLVQERRGFRYVPVPGGRPLTASPAGAEEPWDAGFSRAWFDGLLPEGEQRTAAERRHRVERGDTFGLLAAIGWECAGAVSVLPPGRTPADGHYRPLTQDEVSARVDAAPAIVDEFDLEVRLSLGGTQDKVLLARDDDGWQLPLEGAPSTHILKPEPARFAGLVLGEAWALAAAAAVTTVAQAEVRSVVDHRPALVVTRYDRVRTADGLRRLHQEDLCQVLGLPPEAKYAQPGPRLRPGDPKLSDLAGFLLMRSEDPPAELSRLLEQLVVTVALGNADAHAKNHSLVHHGAAVALSPLYDVISTIAFLPEQRHAALAVDGKFRLDEITRAHVHGEARSWGIPEREARTTIDGAIERLQAGMAAADELYPELARPVRAMVRSHAERFLRSRASL
jgi:serine/threonine-protein kinase HipA